jgi:hypothetical protein
MPTELHIKSLTCVKKQDTVGKDKAVLKIGGRTIGGPYLMAKGDSLTLNITEPFTTSVQVTLMEEDAGSDDDDLGTVTVYDTLPEHDNQDGVFHRLSGADYHMVYHIHTD